MAMIDTARPAPFGAITAYRATELFSNVVFKIRERIEAYRTAQALARLSPRMLDDIGITEADVLAYRNNGRFF